MKKRLRRLKEAVDCRKLWCGWEAGTGVDLGREKV